MGLFEPIIKTANKIIDKIPSSNDRAKLANQVLEGSKEEDINQENKSSKANAKSLLWWLELACVIGFSYTYLLVPICNDVLHTSLKGIGNEAKLDNMLYAVLGLGGIRIANTIIGKRGR